MVEPHGSCTQALHHGPTTRAGRCPWCGRKLEPALPAPERVDRTELDEAYSLVYDPDEGSRGWVEFKRAWKSGTLNY